MRTSRILGPLGSTVAALAALTLIAAPAAAAGQEQVDGLLTPDTGGVCVDDAASLGTYVVSGDLTGCWYVDELTIRTEAASGAFRATGREQFVGCLGNRCGRFFTTYVFTARIVDGVETHGRCHHPIVGGDGGFAGVRGSLEMHDLPDGCAVYTGHLSF